MSADIVCTGLEICSIEVLIAIGSGSYSDKDLSVAYPGKGGCLGHTPDSHCTTYMHQHNTPPCTRAIVMQEHANSYTIYPRRRHGSANDQSKPPCFVLAECLLCLLSLLCIIVLIASASTSKIQNSKGHGGCPTRHPWSCSLSG